MIPKIIIYIFVVFFIDMILTYRYVKAYKEMYPRNNWILAESNPILRGCMKYHGLEKGLIFGAMIILFLLVIILKVLPNDFRWFFAGFYTMANVYHFVNWSALKRLIESKGGKK